jgi:hypothetical protein
MGMKALVVSAAALFALAASAPDVTVLARRAGKLVRAEPSFRKAVLLEADGAPATYGDTVKTADGIVKWRFVFNNQESGDKYKSATVFAVRGKFGKVQGHPDPFLEDQEITRIPAMTLPQAIGRLHKAHYTHGFSAVTLREPIYPGVTHPEYIFTMAGGKYVAVDTQTGKVKRVS